MIAMAEALYYSKAYIFFIRIYEIVEHATEFPGQQPNRLRQTATKKHIAAQFRRHQPLLKQLDQLHRFHRWWV